jgi:predicted nucleotidyltransferase
MLDLIEQNRTPLKALCNKYGVRRLDLFGSAAEGQFDPERSDLDFVVDFSEQASMDAFDRFFGLQFDLEALFGRKVDLVTDRSIRNPYFRRSVDTSRIPVYDA